MVQKGRAMDKGRNTNRFSFKLSRRLRRRLLQIAVIAGGVAIIIGIIAIVNFALNSDGFRDRNATRNSSDDTIAGEEEEPELIKDIKYLWYYDEAYKERYISFAAARPGLSHDKICWMVLCDLDQEPYVYASEVANPNDILVLTSKHFYLPDGYVPTDLITLGETQMRKEAGEAMNEMTTAAWTEGHTLWSQSGYRSNDLQTELYNGYLEREGQAAADATSARPGHSEHQTGLVTDLNTITDDFGTSPEGIWVAENCWKYGYIVRYTSENTDVTLFKPEPWHMRYIGKEAAKKMHDEGIVSFEEYWAKYVR